MTAYTRALSSSQSAVQILAETIGAHLPAWIWRAAIHLPTPTLKALRTARYLTERLGDRIVREKIEAARMGLENNTDVFGLLGAYFHATYGFHDLDSGHISGSKSFRQEEEFTYPGRAGCSDPYYYGRRARHYGDRV
jgi:hypothetical protein